MFIISSQNCFLILVVLALVWTLTVLIITSKGKVEKVKTLKLWFMKVNQLKTKVSLNVNALFPNDTAAGDDRILNQLMYAPAYLEDKPKKLVIVSDKERRNLTSLMSACPLRRCEFTSDLSRLFRADALIVDDHLLPWWNKPEHQIWIAYSLEAPVIGASPFLFALWRSIDWTATYRRDSDIVAPYAKWIYYDPLFKQAESPAKNYAAGKRKLVAWFVSNCEKTLRWDYAKNLSLYIQVDVYGDCGNKLCPRGDPTCWEMLRTDYKFYLSFENSQCKDYITEKLYDNALGNDVIPVVMGPERSDYEAVAPFGSFIHVDDYQSPEHLAAYLRSVASNDSLYNEYFRWKGTGEFIDTYFHCRVCAMLHSGRTTRHQDVRSWWHNNSCTTLKVNPQYNVSSGAKLLREFHTLPI